MNEAYSVKARKNKKAQKQLSSLKKKKSNPLIGFIGKVSGLAFVLYCICSIVFTQYEIAEKQKELDRLESKAQELEAVNDQYQSILNEEDEQKYMERIAMEVLGYAYPTERRFYDTARNN